MIYSFKVLNSLHLWGEDSPHKILILHYSSVAVGEKLQIADLESENGIACLVFLAEFAIFNIDYILLLNSISIGHL